MRLIELFEELEYKHIEDLKHYYALSNYEECAHNIVSNFIWCNKYPLYVYKSNKYMLLMNHSQDESMFFMPLCKKEDFKDALIDIKSLVEKCEYENITFNNYLKEYIDTHKDVFKDYASYEVINSRDYVYESEKLISFSGKKLQKKRNHLNAFYLEYDNRFTYEKINVDNCKEVLEYLDEWYSSKDDESLIYERNGIMNILPVYDKLELIGGLIRIDGKVKAFSIASKLSDEMVEVHIEKADESIRGLYQAICKEFTLNELSNFHYVNREDDMGNENLRHAKLAMQPCKFINKFYLYKDTHD